MAAVIAFVDVGAQCVGAAPLDGRHRLVLLWAQLVVGAVGGSVFPEDVGNLKGGVGRLRRELPVDLVACEIPFVHARGE